MARSSNRYQQLIEHVFFSGYSQGDQYVEFERDDLVSAAQELAIDLPKNLGDVIYAIRYRIELPDAIIKLQPRGKEWVIEGAGRSRYVFRLVKINRIVPNDSLVTIKIPDATPEIVNAYALNDEQALLAKVRYNRLIDIFLGITTYSLQNHLRTTVAELGQVEVDEIYVGIDKHGRHFVLPVQAKGGSDQLSVVQSKQDMAMCAEKYPDLICRAISAQFLENNKLALFEVVLIDDLIKIANEKHYHLVAASEINSRDLALYQQISKDTD